MEAPKRCARCLLTETYPGIAFDENGVCNYCPPDGFVMAPRVLGQDALLAAIPSRDPARDYDCLVGFSGGRDSSYVLYYAVRVLKLRVQAFTIDNGFMPQETLDNIQRAVQTLGVDHVVERHDLVENNVEPFLSAWLRRPSAAMISFLCTGCRLGLTRGFLRAAKRSQTPTVLSGLGEPEPGFAMKLLASGRPGVRGLLAGLGGEMLENPFYVLSRPTLPYWMFLEYLYAGRLYGISRRDPLKRLTSTEMHHVKFFDYLPWCEEEILSTIRAELGWQNWKQSVSSWRSDCKISLLKNALYYRTLGFTKNDLLVSSLVRQGAISREEGLARVERENAVYDRFLQGFLPEIGISYGRYRDAMARAGHGQ